jgi:hypothetical protein
MATDSLRRIGQARYRGWSDIPLLLEPYSQQAEAQILRKVASEFSDRCLPSHHKAADGDGQFNIGQDRQYSPQHAC